MGGYDSTRWNGEMVRTPTDPLLCLDVRWLHRLGALAPGAVCRPQWTRGERPAGSIVTIRDPQRECLHLDYRTQTLGGPWTAVQETIALVWTSCHFGGERPWFGCPGCGSRRAVLFAVGGRFRCRACHRLAYSSTREDAADRSRRRLTVLRTKLGSRYAQPVWTIPPRPTGMHHATYARLVWRIARELGCYDDLADAELARIGRRVAALTAA